MAVGKERNFLFTLVDRWIRSTVRDPRSGGGEAVIDAVVLSNFTTWKPPRPTEGGSA